MEVSSFAHREFGLLLQAAYSNYQFRTFENFHQLVEDTFIVLRPGPEIFFQYELRFVNCLKSQLLIGHVAHPSKLLISHLLLPSRKPLRSKQNAKSSQFWEKIHIFRLVPSTFVSRRGPQRMIAADSWFNTASDVDASGPTTATESRATCFQSQISCWALGSMPKGRARCAAGFLKAGRAPE